MAKRILALCFALLATGVCVAADTGVFQQTKAIGLEEAIRLIPGDMHTPGRYAVVIGVGDYKDKRIGDLPACVNDAQGVYETLADTSVGMFKKENIFLLLNESVTVRKIVSVLDEIATRAGKDDLVLIYFSGHGAVDKRGYSYWVMHDTDISSLRATALRESDISELLSDIKTTRLVTLIDSCYSAATAELDDTKAILDLKKLYPKFSGKGRVAITASDGDQLSLVIKDKKHPGVGFSAFSWHIIQALKGAGDVDYDGVVTVDELWGYVKDRTETTARRHGGNQQPQLKGQIGSRFLLTIDAPQLRRNILETEQVKQLRQQRLAKLWQYYLDEKLSVDLYQLARQLVEKPTDTLDEMDKQKLREIVAVTDGSLEPGKLQRALDAIETPAQRAIRLEREAKERAERVKQAKIKELLSIAQSNNNKMDGKKALDALQELLALDPSLSEALALQKKISGYYGPSAGDVITNSIGMKLVYIPPGKFIMGGSGKVPGLTIESDGKVHFLSDEHPQLQVRISKGFYMGVYEVTQSQLYALIGYVSSLFKGDSYPVDLVTWEMAMDFCKKLSQKENGRTYRLPTEAEWEYACRAGATTKYSFGNNQSDLGDYAWYKDNSNNKTHPVGMKKSNAFGLYDMHGNVKEWCSDWYAYDYYSQNAIIDPRNAQGKIKSRIYSQNVIIDPLNNLQGKTKARILRGGGWKENASGCRSAQRAKYNPNTMTSTHSYIGFRVVMIKERQ